jgi:hypothetical protein
MSQSETYFVSSDVYIIIHNTIMVTYLPLYLSVNSLLYTFLLKFTDLLVVVKKIEN